jgi:hypothetical protein
MGEFVLEYALAYICILIIFIKKSSQKSKNTCFIVLFVQTIKSGYHLKSKTYFLAFSKGENWLFREPCLLRAFSLDQDPIPIPKQVGCIV